MIDFYWNNFTLSKLFFSTPKLIYFLSRRLRNIFQLKDNELFADQFLYQPLSFSQRAAFVLIFSFRVNRPTIQTILNSKAGVSWIKENKSETYRNQKDGEEETRRNTSPRANSKFRCTDICKNVLRERWISSSLFNNILFYNAIIRTAELKCQLLLKMFLGCN